VKLAPLERGAEFASVWQELNEVFDKARGRDLRELINGAIERQRNVVPVARAAPSAGWTSCASSPSAWQSSRWWPPSCWRCI
jgi:hypothetical protein